MPKSDKTRAVVEAISLLRTHTADGECHCSHCEQAKAVIAANPEMLKLLSKIL